MHGQKNFKSDMKFTQAIKTFDTLVRNRNNITFEVVHLRQMCQ